ncbi:MAG: VWA domain-containing protein [Planctomycetes bacterium]|nr:VWA domain-containing protein [Planctomycetota bacterium]
MSFLHFGLLPYFLPLVAVPILLHLLTLHRLKTVELSTFRFLFDSYVQQRRRMKFLEALIAFLRTLFLLILVLLICRPVVKHWSAMFGGSQTGRDVVLLIDGSASMNAVTEGITSLERAKRAAIAVTDRLSVDDRVTVIRVAAKPEEVCNRFSSDAEAIRNEIESLQATPSRGNLFAAFSQLFGPESRRLNEPAIYLFSDLQSTGWDEFIDGTSTELIPPDTELTVVNVGSNQEFANVAVVGQSPEDQRAIAGLPIKLNPRVTNYSETESRDIPVSIFIEDKEIARKTLTLEPGETGDAELIFTPTEAGVLRGRFEIPRDRFDADDSFLFSLNVAPQIRVLLVNGNPSVQPLDNEGLYLQTAMVATDPSEETEADPDLVEEREFVRSLLTEDVPQSSVTVEALGDADVVILANCGGLNPAQFKMIREFVADGGGLLVCPGDKVNHDAYTKQFFPSPEIPDQAFVAAELTPPQGDPNNSETHRRLGAIDFAHPVFSVFADSEQRYLTKLKIYRYFPYKLPEERGNSWPLVEFEDGSPALLESVYGNGRVLLTAFPLNTKWTNLPMKPEFVPLVLRMIGHVKRSSDVDGPLVVPADGTAEFVVSQDWAPAEGTVKDAKGRMTPVEFQRSNSRLVGAFERTVEKGFYELDVTGGQAEKLQRGLHRFAVNVAADESDFLRLTKPQIEAMLPSAKLTTVDASAEAQQLYGSIGDEREIWRPLIILTFAIIVIEFLLSTLGGHSLDDRNSPTAGQRLKDLARAKWVGRMTGSGFRELTGSQADD